MFRDKNYSKFLLSPPKQGHLDYLTGHVNVNLNGKVTNLVSLLCSFAYGLQVNYKLLFI